MDKFLILIDFVSFCTLKFLIHESLSQKIFLISDEPNSSIDSKLQLLNLGLRLYSPILSKFFPIHKEIENCDF